MTTEPKASERLTKALKEAGAKASFIALAKDGWYGDFTSPLATPITQLVEDADKAGLHDIAQRAMLGEFDGR